MTKVDSLKHARFVQPKVTLFENYYGQWAVQHRVLWNARWDWCWVNCSGVARAFPGGQLAHPEGKNVEENDQSLRKNIKKSIAIWAKMRKVELLPTRDCEAGYGPGAKPHDGVASESFVLIQRCVWAERIVLIDYCLHDSVTVQCRTVHRKCNFLCEWILNVSSCLSQSFVTQYPCKGCYY